MKTSFIRTVILIAVFSFLSFESSFAGELIYSTYLGGSGSPFGGDVAYGIAVDGGGNTYVTGWTESIDFPTTPGAWDTTFHSIYYGNGGGNCLITKLNTTGSNLVYSTFLGGLVDDEGYGIKVDSAGNAYITGITYSPDFPTTPGAFDTTYSLSTDLNGYIIPDAFVTKLNFTGSNLVYSTFLRGKGSDWGNSIALDGAGNAYVTGITYSPDFPTTPGSWETTYRGYGSWVSNSFITKLDVTGSTLVYSTFLGGTTPSNYIPPGGKWSGGYNNGKGIAVDSAGNAYVTGLTQSPDFPTTAGAWDTTFTNDYYGEIFITKLNSTGSTLIYSTFLGGTTGQNLPYSIAIDSAGNAYVTGGTSSFDFPTTPGAWDTTFLYGGISGCFVTKLNAMGSNLAYSTLLGGSWEDTGFSIAVDSAGNAFVSGFTSSPDFPTTPGAWDTTHHSGGANYDCFVTKLNAMGSNVLYSTYLGGNDNEKGYGIAIDSAGNAYATGYTWSSDFPTTLGAWDTTYNGTASCFITKLNLNSQSTPTANFLGIPNYGNSPLAVQFFERTIGNPTSWSWYFGDGGTSTIQNPIHTYRTFSASTWYSVQLIVSNSYGTSTMTKPNYINILPSLTYAGIFPDEEDLNYIKFSHERLPKDGNFSFCQ